MPAVRHVQRPQGSQRFRKVNFTLQKGCLMTRIALDAMGGDKAPGEIVLGGVKALVGLEDIKVFLVGRKE